MIFEPGSRSQIVHVDGSRRNVKAKKTTLLGTFEVEAVLDSIHDLEALLDSLA